MKQFKNYRKHSALCTILCSEHVLAIIFVVSVAIVYLGGGKKDGQSYWQFYKEYSEVRLSRIRCGNR